MGSDADSYCLHAIFDCISIHAPRMGSDTTSVTACPTMTGFQSTLPVWGATKAASSRAFSDRHFNPRSPYGERHTRRLWVLVGRLGFQSTLPVWGATCAGCGLYSRRHDFNPRSPYGERPWAEVANCRCKLFQSTLPVWGATANIHNYI